MNIRLNSLDDRVMSTIVNFKSRTGYYPNVSDLLSVSRLGHSTLQKSLTRLQMLKKVKLIKSFNVENPIVKG